MQLNSKSYGQGEPLIILHGLFGTLDNWQTLARQWANYFTVFALDLRNHGRSPFADTHSYRDLANDLTAWMDANGVYKTHLLGHSMGGKAAMQFATEQADRINKLVLVDIAPKAYSGGHETVLKALHAVDLTTQPTRKEVELQLATFLQDDQATLQFLLKNLSRGAATGQLEWKINIPVLTAYYSAILGEIIIDTPIEVPTLFVRGAKSKYIQDSDWTDIHDSFPNAQLATIPNAGHWVHAENPTAFSEAVLHFLAQ